LRASHEVLETYEQELAQEYLHYPTPIAHAIQSLLQESLINSADELITLLEILLKHMGWLWIVEYIYSDHVDERLNHLLFSSILENQRSLSVGSWAYVGSNISRLYQKNDWDAQISVLQALDYGNPQDNLSPLSRLLSYRNSFAHGSFATINQEIISHRILMWEWLEPLKGFRDFPIAFRHPQHQEWLIADGHNSPLHAPPKNIQHMQKVDAGPPEIILQTPAQQSFSLDKFLSLYPIQPQTKEVKPLISFDYFSIPKSSKQEKRELLSARQKLAFSLKEYQSQKRGIFHFSEVWKKTARPKLPKREWLSIQNELKKCIDIENETRPTFVMLSGYPGSGKSAVIKQAKALFPQFDGIIKFQIRSSHISQSTAACISYFSRQIEKILELPHANHPHLTLQEVQSHFQQVLDRLKEKDKRVLICIDRFHHAYQKMPHENTRIYDFLVRIRNVSSKHLVFLLTARPGYRNDLLGDAVVEMPVAELQKSECYVELLQELGLEKGNSTLGLSNEEVAFRRALLRILAGYPEGATVFQACDTLQRFQENHAQSFPKEFVFTPHVERAIWELRPLLAWEHRSNANQVREKFFRPFCPHFASWIQTHTFND